MAIEFNCPHCGIPYRLKDELAGKKATCKNPDCRQVITVPVPKPQPKPEDVEAAALAALADAPKAEQAADAPIPMVCAFCDHKWTEPREKAGKNVLCPNPECRQRNKVPVPKDEKPKDWREADQGPSLRKELFEKPTDVVTSGDAKYAGRDALEQAGAFDHFYEPVPLKRKLFFAALILTPIVGIAVAIWWGVTRVSERRDDRLIEDALKQFSPDALPPADGHLFAATLNTAAAQYQLTETDNPEKALKEALAYFTKARDDLRHAAQKEDAKKGGGGAARFAVAGELALAQLGLGGTDDEVTAGTRYRWVPQPAGGRKMRVNEKAADVHTELQRTLQLVLPADYDFRIALARRLTRELARLKQPDLAADLPAVLFSNPEQAEAKAVVALELLRADKAHPFPKQAAEELKATLAKGAEGKSPFPASAAVLWKAVGTDKAPKLGDGNLPAAPVPDNARALAVGLAVLDGRNEDAAEAIRRSGGTPIGQLRAAVLFAEGSPDPTPALDVILARVTVPPGKKVEPGSGPPASPLLRLSQLAAVAGKVEQAKQLADAIPDEGLKVWAKADALRLAAAPGTRLDESSFEAPDDPAKLRAGHAWGRFWVARHNTRITHDRTKERDAVKGWPSGTVQPLGLAGVALGLRERAP